MMSIKGFNEDLINLVVKTYRENYSVLPGHVKELYESEEAMMYDGYVAPLERIREGLSDLFRFTKEKQEFEIKSIYEQGVIERLEIGEISYLVLDILINEKTRQGLFATLIMMGIIGRVIDRLATLSSVKGQQDKALDASLQLFLRYNHCKIWRKI